MTQIVEERHRNLAVYILFALAVIAGILALVDAARYMGWLGYTIQLPGLGEIQFVLPEAKWFAAIMSAIVGIIWFVVAWWLWNLNPSGWLFVVVIAIFNLILLFLAILGRTTFAQVLPAVAINALALILALIAKDEFVPQLTPEAAAAADAAKARAAEQAAAREEAAKEAAAARAAATAAAAEAAAAEPEPAPAVKFDDLTKIEGVGPQIASGLRAAGITSYDELKATSVDELRQILADAGYSADPSTWPAQARLAAAGRWEDLEALQDDLEGGRVA